MCFEKLCKCNQQFFRRKVTKRSDPDIELKASSTKKSKKLEILNFRCICKLFSSDLQEKNRVVHLVAKNLRVNKSHAGTPASYRSED